MDEEGAAVRGCEVRRRTISAMIRGLYLTRSRLLHDRSVGCLSVVGAADLEDVEREINRLEMIEADMLRDSSWLGLWWLAALFSGQIP